MSMREKKLDSGLKQNHGPEDPRRKDSPFSSPNPGVTRYDYRERLLEYDPRTKKPIYKGQKPDSEPPKGRTISEEALEMGGEPEKKETLEEIHLRGPAYSCRNPILDIWNAKIDLTDYDISPRFEVDEKHKELARKIYTSGSDELTDKKKESEKKKEKTPQERFEDFMREKPKDSY